jgi:hypothetical protein
MDGRIDVLGGWSPDDRSVEVADERSCGCGAAREALEESSVDCDMAGFRHAGSMTPNVRQLVSYRCQQSDFSCDFAYFVLLMMLGAQSITPDMVKGSERRVARLTLRLPPSLRDAIGRCAEKDRRSVSDWIVRTLEDAVAASEAKNTKPK